MKMTRWICLLIIAQLDVSNNVMAQYSGSEFLKEGKTWNYECTYYGMDDNGNIYNKTSPYKEWIEGDSVIHGKIYYKMHTSEIAFPATSATLWREEEGRVYCYWEYSDSDELMYDFTLKKGDKIDILGIRGLEVTNIDTIFVAGTRRKRLNISGIAIWVEGIGSPYLLAEPLGHTLSDGNVSYLQSCFEDGICIFTAEDFLASAYHASNDVTSTPRVNAISVTNSPKYYDLQGRRLSGTPTRGLYIRDGRKVLLREK